MEEELGDRDGGAGREGDIKSGVYAVPTGFGEEAL